MASAAVRHLDRPARPDDRVLTSPISIRSNAAPSNTAARTSPAPPLLIIAGAGSGKTNTLAHRVAHLVVNGVDPRRILLLTFSRRAAAEMTRRVERIAATGALGGKAAARRRSDLVGHLPCHRRAAAARIRAADRARPRLHHPRSRGLGRPAEPDPARSRLLEDRKPLSRPRAPAWRSIRARECAEPLGEVLRPPLSLVRDVGSGAARLFAAYVEAKQRQNVLDYDDLLLYWAQMMAEPSIADDVGGRFDHVLVDEYQDTNRLQASILLALKPGRQRPHRGRRRCPIDLFVPRGDGAQHPRLPGQFTPRAEIVTLDRNYRSTQPILAAANAVIELATSASPRTSGRTAPPPSGRSWSRARRSRPGALRRRAGAGEPRGRHRAQAAGGAVSDVAPQRAARDRAHPPQHSRS